MVPRCGVDPLLAEGSYIIRVRGSPSTFTLDRFREGFVSSMLFPPLSFNIYLNASVYVPLPKIYQFVLKGYFTTPNENRINVNS